jgi:N-acetylglucosamine transport system permease protein
MKPKNKTLLKRWLTRAILIFIAFISIFPLFWNAYSSFKTNQEFLRFESNSLALPEVWDFSSYSRAWLGANIDKSFFNSGLAVLILLLVTVVCVIPCSYALARHSFFGSRFILNLFMAAVFIKATYIMIPLYQLVSGLQIVNSLTAYAVLYAVLQFPFAIFLMTGYMRAIPHAFEEAAMIDGCGHFRTLTQIIIPMAKPGIFTVCMLSGLAIWNELPVAMVMLTNDSVKTLPLGLAALHIRTGTQADYAALLAALTIVLIPTISFFALGQRYLIQGIGAGGVK